MSADSLNRNSLMVFAGAGISMIPPSSLPNWFQFNEAILTSLANEVSIHTRQELGERAFSELIARRNLTSNFLPDYMADIITEEIGEVYFKIVQALDAEETNACHQALARLANAGVVRAVVTTNFDRLIERAFEQEGVNYRVYVAAWRFEDLESSQIKAGIPEVPIIKVHGTVEDIDSMVDTLSQRRVGRPVALLNALADLYSKHHVLFLGFSGADLDYDENYLGLLRAAENNKGFTLLVREGDKPRDSMQKLKAAWGESATIVNATLPTWLCDLTQKLGIKPASWSSTSVQVDPLRRVNEQAGAWAKSLSRLEQINALAGLLRASGNDATAGRLFWDVWKRYRQPEDLEGPVYARFNHLIGRFLLDYGFDIESLRPDTSFVVVPADGPNKSIYADNAFQYLGRASYENARALSDLAACYALMGKARQSLDLLNQALTSAIEHEHRLMFMDAVINGGLVWSIVGLWSHGLAQLKLARDIAIHLGMEPRRAALCAHLVRFLGWKGEAEEAFERYQEGINIAKRLGLESLQFELQTAWGYVLNRQRRASEALPLLSESCDYYEGTSRKVLLTRAALDLYDAATLAQDQSALDRSSKLLEEVERGYLPHVYALQLEAGYLNGDIVYMRDRLPFLKKAADETGNDWAKKVAEAFEERLEEMSN